MVPYADLHLHTNHSDGSDSPSRVVERAAGMGFSAIAVTDHDAVTGVEEARARANALGLGFLSGVELSASYGRIEVHVVGLGIDVGHAPLRAALDRLREGRSVRTDRMLEQLKCCGIELSREEVEVQLADGGTLGRVHVARALKARGITKTVQEGFDRFIRSGRKAYVPKASLGCLDALALIHEAGGLAILAHPGVGATLPKIVARLLEMPFDGIEVFHTKHTPVQSKGFMQLAHERGLLVSGGSDCHGTATKREPEMGRVRLPIEYVERIQEALGYRSR
jgi:3',5'-nucleoside bisphosphate phosphatase